MEREQRASSSNNKHSELRRPARGTDKFDCGNQETQELLCQ